MVSMGRERSRPPYQYSSCSTRFNLLPTHNQRHRHLRLTNEGHGQLSPGLLMVLCVQKQLPPFDPLIDNINPNLSQS